LGAFGGSQIGLLLQSFFRTSKKDFRDNPSRESNFKFEVYVSNFSCSRVKDASENPFACLLQKIAAGQPDGAAFFAPTRPNSSTNCH
jgi:hypothetical protein